jgi:hypothetical protein
MTVRRVLAGLVVMLTLGGCFDYRIDPLEPPVTVSFATVEQGTASGIRSPKLVVVRTEKEWTELWAAHTASVSPAPTAAPVDFSQDMIVAAFAGEKPTGGSRIQIERLETQQRNKVLIVTYQQTDPTPGTAAIQMLTQPFHIVKAKKSDGAPLFMQLGKPAKS